MLASCPATATQSRASACDWQSAGADPTCSLHKMAMTCSRLLRHRFCRHSACQPTYTMPCSTDGHGQSPRRVRGTGFVYVRSLCYINRRFVILNVCFYVDWNFKVIFFVNLFLIFNSSVVIFVLLLCYLQALRRSSRASKGIRPISSPSKSCIDLSP